MVCRPRFEGVTKGLLENAHVGMQQRVYTSHAGSNKGTSDSDPRVRMNQTQEVNAWEAGCYMIPFHLLFSIT